MNLSIVWGYILYSLKKRFYNEVEIAHLYRPMLDYRLPNYRFTALVTRVVPNTLSRYPSSYGPGLDAQVFVIPFPWPRSLWPIRFEFPVLGIWKLWGRGGVYLDGKILMGRWFEFQPILRTKEERYKAKWLKSSHTQ